MELLKEQKLQEEKSLSLKQDNLYWEFNTETQKIDILWILETEDGKYYQKMKSINPFSSNMSPKVTNFSKDGG
jgi:hypothetical protein